MNILAITVGWILAIIIACFGAILIFLMAAGKIDLSKLLSEPGGDASTSRFQFVIFTFVIAMSLFLIVGLIPKNWTVEKCSSAQVKGAEGNEEKSVQ